MAEPNSTIFTAGIAAGASTIGLRIPAVRRPDAQGGAVETHPPMMISRPGPSWRGSVPCPLPGRCRGHNEPKETLS